VERPYLETFPINVKIASLLDYTANLQLWVAHPSITRATLQATVAWPYSSSDPVTVTIQQQYRQEAPVTVAVTWPYLTQQPLKGRVRDDADDYLIYTMILNLID
jgi:hypothetical protein